jgi:hypothetical protein
MKTCVHCTCKVFLVVLAVPFDGEGRTIAQEVIRQLPTPEAWVQARVR